MRADTARGYIRVTFRVEAGPDIHHIDEAVPISVKMVEDLDKGMAVIVS